MRDAARARLAALVDPALARLGKLVDEPRDKKVALGAVRDVLDRNDLTGKTQGTTAIQVNISAVEFVIVDVASPAD